MTPNTCKNYFSVVDSLVNPAFSLYNLGFLSWLHFPTLGTTLSSGFPLHFSAFVTLHGFTTTVRSNTSSGGHSISRLFFRYRTTLLRGSPSMGFQVSSVIGDLYHLTLYFHLPSLLEWLTIRSLRYSLFAHLLFPFIVTWSCTRSGRFPSSFSWSTFFFINSKTGGTSITLSLDTFSRFSPVRTTTVESVFDTTRSGLSITGPSFCFWSCSPQNAFAQTQNSQTIWSHSEAEPSYQNLFCISVGPRPSSCLLPATIAQAVAATCDSTALSWWHAYFLPSVSRAAVELGYTVLAHVHIRYHNRICVLSAYARVSMWESHSLGLSAT